MSEAWDAIEDGKRYRRHDGWLVVRDHSGKIHAIPPDGSEALDEEGKPRRSFDSPNAAMDFVDQHHPS